MDQLRRGRAVSLAERQMKRSVRASLYLAVLLGLGCSSQQPQVDKTFLPHVREPAFDVLEYMPKDKVLESTYCRSITEILNGREYIIRAFDKVMPLDRRWFSYEKSNGVKIGDQHYRRDIYLYTYYNIEGDHGPPEQSIMIWYDFPDGLASDATNIWKIFTGKPMFPL